MKERNLAVFAIEMIALKKFMNLPEEIEIVGLDYDMANRRLVVKIEGPGLPVVKEGAIIPAISPTITQQMTPDGFTNIIWDFNGKSADIIKFPTKEAADVGQD